MGLLRRLVDYANQNAENLPDDIMEIAQEAETAIHRVKIVKPV